MMKHKLIRALGVLGVSVLLTNTALAAIAVIGNPKRTEQLDKDQVKALYWGDKSSLGSGPVKLIDQDGVIKGTFYEKVLGKSLQEVKTQWSTLIFTGAAKAPMVKSGDDEVIAVVKSDEAAIGYIDASKVNSSVKVLYKAE